MHSIANVKGASALYAQVTRADGSVEPRRLVAYHHPNPLRRLVVHGLMLLGAL